MKKSIRRILVTALSVVIAQSFIFSPIQGHCEEVDNQSQESISVKSGFTYTHDPRLDSKAMQDIIYNPDAVYGFSPNPNSGSLTEYAKYDFTDPVAVESWRQERIAYHQEMLQMFKLWDQLIVQGKSPEEIARAISNKRNQIRMASYKDNLDGLATMKKRNLEKYGNENGPTPDSLYEKYGSWEKVIEKAFSSNSGMDACLGLYDDEYEHNIMTGSTVVGNPVFYTAKPGDNLSTISEMYFGTKNSWMYIYEYNKGTIKDYNNIQIGQIIVIPIL